MRLISSILIARIDFALSTENLFMRLICKESLPRYLRSIILQAPYV